MSGRQKLLSLEFAERCLSSRSLRRFCWLLRWVGGFRAWLRRGPHQFAQPDEIVGSGRQREYPADTGQTAMTGLAEPATALVQPNTSSMRLRTRPLTA